MAIFRANGLAKYFGERELFSDVTFEVEPQDRIGLVGVNGCGKSTLFRMLTGRESVDAGQISVSRDCTVASLDQQTPAKSGVSLYDATVSVFEPLMEMERLLLEIADRIEAGEGDVHRLVERQDVLNERYTRLGGLTYRSRTRATLLGLGFQERELTRDLSLMSGGEARKAMLARILLSDAGLLLLDEPTNHLDIQAVEWLESYLSGFSGACIVISHDRYFLDHVTRRTFELERGRLHVSRGNYSRYVELKMGDREIAQRKYENTQREIKRIEGIIDQQRRWNQARNYVTIASKEKQIERLRRDLVKPDPLPESMRFTFRPVEPAGNDVLILKRLAKSFGDLPLFSDVNLHVRKNERICLIGGNGCGKTTLLRILTGAEQPDTGTYVIGANVQIGYYEQSLIRFTPDNTVLNELWDAFPRLEQQQIRNVLGQFLFHGDDVNKIMRTLSGGELARLQLLKLMLLGSNLLLLDEPTNHLDIASREALEKALSAYGGTMLIVTHDRYFINKIADRIVLLDKNGLVEFSGDWDGYKALLAETESEEPAAEDVPPVNDYKRNKERRSAINRARGELQRAEARVSEAEAAVTALETELARPEIASDYAKSIALCEQIQAAKSVLDDAYTAWETADRQLFEMTEEAEETAKP